MSWVEFKLRWASTRINSFCLINLSYYQMTKLTTQNSYSWLENFLVRFFDKKRMHLRTFGKIWSPNQMFSTASFINPIMWIFFRIFLSSLIDIAEASKDFILLKIFRRVLSTWFERGSERGRIKFSIEGFLDTHQPINHSLHNILTNLSPAKILDFHLNVRK